MGIAAKETAPDIVAEEGFEGRYTDVDGTTIGFESFRDEMDPSPLFKGLPDDHCQSPHWGYVIKGQITFTYTDGSQDVATAGQAYYARPGHLPLLAGGTELVEFSPTDELAKTMAVIMQNMSAVEA